MLKRVSQIVTVLLVLTVVGAVAFLLPAHLQIRRVHPPLPSLDAVREAVARAARAGDGPVRLSWINTSSQQVPRWGVLGTGDPHPERAYRLCHSSFVLEWSDGRRLLVDTGMTRPQAKAFGVIGEWTGAEPTEVLTTVAEELQSNGHRVDGVVFTHLHVDHVDGVRELCESLGDGALPIFMTRNQASLTNYTTREAFDTLRELRCLDWKTLPEDSTLASVEGFPGIYVIQAAGHTPGSQMILAVLRWEGVAKPVVFTGDIVNHIDGVEYDVGKPFGYRMLIVPEDDGRLGELRRLIRSLRDDAGFEVLVSHDQLALEASSIPRYSRGPSRQ